MELIETNFARNIDDLNNFIDEELALKKSERLIIEKQLAGFKIFLDKNSLDINLLKLLVDSTQELKQWAKISELASRI